jgi:hypothetical protein
MILGSCRSLAELRATVRILSGPSASAHAVGDSGACCCCWCWPYAHGAISLRSFLCLSLRFRGLLWSGENRILVRPFYTLCGDFRWQI